MNRKEYKGSGNIIPRICPRNLWNPSFKTTDSRSCWFYMRLAVDFAIFKSVGLCVVMLNLFIVQVLVMEQINAIGTSESWDIMKKLSSELVVEAKVWNWAVIIQIKSYNCIPKHFQVYKLKIEQNCSFYAFILKFHSTNLTHLLVHSHQLPLTVYPTEKTPGILESLQKCSTCEAVHCSVRTVKYSNSCTHWSGTMLRLPGQETTCYFTHTLHKPKHKF